MMHASIITKGGKRVQMVDEPSDCSANADYYILWKDRFKFVEHADMLLHFEKEDYITKVIATQLVAKGLLWPAIHT